MILTCLFIVIIRLFSKRKKPLFIAINLKQEMNRISKQIHKNMTQQFLWKFLMTSFSFIEYNSLGEKLIFKNIIPTSSRRKDKTFFMVLFSDTMASMACNMVNVFSLMYSELWTAHETLNTIYVCVVFLAECQIGLPWGKPYAVCVNISRKDIERAWIEYQRLQKFEMAMHI